MVELRWLTRPRKVILADGIQHTAHVERVLQYRQYLDRGTHEPLFDWTEWQDVPCVQEELP